MIKRIIVILFAIFCVFPLLITFSNSLMSMQNPKIFSLRQYEVIFFLNPQYLIWFWNSVKITAFVILINVPISLLAGYGFSKYDFPFKNLIFFMYIIVMLMPFQATLVPQYLTIKAFNLMNKTAAVVLPNAFGAFGVFLMTQFMKGINNELIEAGKMDGLQDTSVFLYLIVPLCKSAIAALFIILFIDSWSMIEQPLIFLIDINKFPLSLHMGSISLIDGKMLYAGGVVFMVLPLLIYFYGYEDLVSGICLSSIK